MNSLARSLAISVISRCTMLALALGVFGAAPARAASCPSCSEPSFGPAARAMSTRIYGPQHFGGIARSVVPGDFNGDGIPDLVVGSGQGTLLYVGTGSGTYRPPILLATAEPDVLIAADFNGDGNLDLAFPGGVLLGDGAGGFPTALPFNFNVGSMAAGDFDGDGIVDLAIADTSGNVLQILHGVGDGTFLPAQSFVIGSSGNPTPHLVVQAADLNGDGIADIAVENTEDSQIGILLGHPGGMTLTFAPTPGAVGGPIRIGDFNGDGHLDLLAASAPDMFNPDSLTVLLGAGDGTFHLGSSFVVGYSPLVEVGDFTGDGKLDIAVIKGPDTSPFAHGLFIYPGTGLGTFSAPVNTIIPLVGPMFAVSDLNLDGKLDIVMPDSTEEIVTVMLGTGDGHFEEASRFPSGTLGTMGMAGGDFNQDGIPDVVVVGYVPGTAAVLLGDGAGGFQAPLLTPVPSVNGAPVVADFNNDGKLDVAVPGGFPDFTVLLGTGDGTFGPPIPAPTNGQSSFIWAGDFHHNGHPDLIVEASGGFQLYAGNGDGTFQAPTALPLIGVTSVVVQDVDGDGIPDIVAATWTPTASAIAVLFSKGDGTFRPPVVSPLAERVDEIALGDMDNDGKLDVVVSYSQNQNIGVLLGNGAGSFAPVAATQFGSGKIALADVTGDGLLDVVVSSQNDVAILAGTGGGNLAPQKLYTLPGIPLSVVIANFDGDDKLDIAVACQGSVYTPPDFVAMLRNTSCSPRRLLLAADVGTCAAPNVPFSSQPSLKVVDDGDNVVACAGGEVSAYIVPGTGASGAFLGGDTSVSVISGSAAFTDLSINLAGTGYVLEFGYPEAGRIRSRAFTVGTGAAASITGSATVCAPTQYTATPGFDTYVWRVDGAFLGTRSTIVIDGRVVGVGHHTLSVTASVHGCSTTTSLSFDVTQPDVTLTVPAAVCWFDGGLTASVPDAGSGAVYSWTVTNGIITSGAGTSSIHFRPGPFGSVVLSVSVTNAQGCADSNTRSIPIELVACPPKDSTFLDGNWTLTSFVAGNGGSTSASEQIVSGNSFRSITNNVNAAPSAVLGVHIYNPFTYDPQVSGSIGTFEYLEDAFCISGCVGQGQITGPAILQGGNFFILSTPLDVGIQTTPHSFDVGAPESDFALVSVTPTSLFDPTQHPDFSYTGAPIQFGFYRASFGGATAFAQTAAIDNWQILIPSGAPQFQDVPFSNFARRYIEALVHAGVTAGCSPGNFCPDVPVTRAQMSVFLLRGKEGASYVPPAATGTAFADVPLGSFAAAWIEEIARRDITAGCASGPPRFCPGDPVTRAQMAVFLLRTKLGPTYVPPPAAGLFADLPASSGFAAWAEDLYNRGISAGCGTSPLRYCPSVAVTRAQMAVFVTVAFGLPLPP